MRKKVCIEIEASMVLQKLSIMTTEAGFCDRAFPYAKNV